jgi:hypothetical protein
VFKPDTAPEANQYKTLFGYNSDDLCEIGFRPILLNHDPPENAGLLKPPTKEQLGAFKVTWYKIHRGYYRVLKGFLKEIDLAYSEGANDQACLFRGVYLLKILDHFTNELRERNTEDESSWRSRVLNPLLQRQLHGICDQDSGKIRRQVGSDAAAAAAFYLTLDPLAPDMIPRLLYGILHVSPVRWSLGHLHHPPSLFGYCNVRQNTLCFPADSHRSLLPDHEFQQVPLCPEVFSIIRKEKLEVYYRHFPKPTVSRIHLRRSEYSMVLLEMSRCRKGRPEIHSPTRERLVALRVNPAPPLALLAMIASPFDGAHVAFLVLLELHTPPPGVIERSLVGPLAGLRICKRSRSRGAVTHR